MAFRKTPGKGFPGPAKRMGAVERPPTFTDESPTLKTGAKPTRRRSAMSNLKRSST